MAWLKKIISGSRFLKKLYEKQCGYDVYLVIGEQVRKLSPDLNNFANYAIHTDIEEIPENEIWIDANLQDAEKFFAVATAIYELKKLQNEHDFEKVRASSLKYNKKIREITDNIKQKPENTNHRLSTKVYIRKYGFIRNENVTVYIVDGRLVRDIFPSDFCDGGNGSAYPWIPNDEIWIENVVSEEEAPYIILHEMVEMSLMKYKKYSYHQSHKIASAVEFHAKEKGISKHGILNINFDHLKEKNNELS